jgi:hypothetical protein
VASIQAIFALRDSYWNLLNSANVVLLEKKDGAQAIANYRPIRIMHSVGKLLMKILATRLCPHLNKLVSKVRVSSSNQEASMITFSLSEGQSTTFIALRHQCFSLN